MAKTADSEVTTQPVRAHKQPNRAKKGSGTTVSVDLKDHPDILEAIRIAAKADDRESSNYLRRRLVDLYNRSLLVPVSVNGEVFDKK